MIVSALCSKIMSPPWFQISLWHVCAHLLKSTYQGSLHSNNGMSITNQPPVCMFANGWLVFVRGTPIVVRDYPVTAQQSFGDYMNSLVFLEVLHLKHPEFFAVTVPV